MERDMGRWSRTVLPIKWWWWWLQHPSKDDEANKVSTYFVSSPYRRRSLYSSVFRLYFRFYSAPVLVLRVRVLYSYEYNP